MIHWKINAYGNDTDEISRVKRQMHLCTSRDCIHITAEWSTKKEKCHHNHPMPRLYTSHIEEGLWGGGSCHCRIGYQSCLEQDLGNYIGIGEKGIRGLQYLNRVMSQRGGGDYPCLLCDAALLQTSVLQHMLDHHNADLPSNRDSVLRAYWTCWKYFTYISLVNCMCTSLHISLQS